jgi:hypothetical protein
MILATVTIANIGKSLAKFITEAGRLVQKICRAASGAKVVRNITPKNGSNLSESKMMPQKTESTTKKRPSVVDTSADNLFWEMLPFSKAKKQQDELAKIAKEPPNGWGGYPNWPTIIKDLTERIYQQVSLGDAKGAASLQMLLQEAQNSYDKSRGALPPKLPMPRGFFPGFIPDEPKKTVMSGGFGFTGI